MTPETSLVIAPDKVPAFKFTPEAEQLKDAALAVAYLVGKVESAEDNERAAQAMIEIKRVSKLLEDASQPFIDQANQFRKAIWAERDRLKLELDIEWIRIKKLEGDWLMLEQMKAREAEKLAKAQLDQLEKEKAEALLQVKNHDQADAVAEVFNQRAADIALPVAPPRAPGQTVKRDWEITVTNPWELAKYHPECVTITPKLGEIKERLRQGLSVNGVKVVEILSANVRLAKERKAVEV